MRSSSNFRALQMLDAVPGTRTEESELSSVASLFVGNIVGCFVRFRCCTYVLSVDRSPDGRGREVVVYRCVEPFRSAGRGWPPVFQSRRHDTVAFGIFGPSGLS